MGLMGPVSKSSHDGEFSLFSKWKNEPSDCVRTVETPLPNPKPDNYQMLTFDRIGKYLILEIQYLDYTNYEGRKILMFEDCTLGALVKQGLIDPHFSENKNFYSPIARFEPTKRGWEMARTLAKHGIQN